MEFWKKLKSIKGFGFVILALIAGTVMLLLPDNSGGSGSGGENFKYHSADDYLANLESKAEELIRTITGSKSCRVMITLDTGYEYYYASNQKLNDTLNGKDSEKNHVIITVDGNEQPVVIEERMPRVLGVAAVCPGIDAAAEYKIIQMLTALFDVTSNRISVTK